MNNTIHTVRTITDHIVDPANDKLTITVLDVPGNGAASHVYQIRDFDTASNPGERHIRYEGRHDHPARHLTILFQNGPIPKVGVNGVTNEALLAIVADRLRGFQSGPFACRENQQALGFAEAALGWLKLRTEDRIKRGVEGTNAV